MGNHCSGKVFKNKETIGDTYTYNNCLVKHSELIKLIEVRRSPPDRKANRSP